jgi:hypothetical protein
VNRARLGLVMGAALLYVLGGAALGIYCLALNARKPVAAPGEPVKQPVEENDSVDEPPALPPPAPVSPDEQRRIDDAIVKGVWFLRDNQQQTGPG